MTTNGNGAAPVTTAYEGVDFFKLDNFLSDSQKELRQQVRDYVQQVVLPNINPYWDKAEFPRDIAMSLRDLPRNIIGGMIRGFGSAGLDPIEMGLVMYELSKGDGSITTFFGVHSGLAMGSIGLLGSDEQRERWMREQLLQLSGSGSEDLPRGDGPKFRPYRPQTA